MNFLKSPRFFAFPFFFFRQIHLIEHTLKRTRLFLFLFLFLQHVIQAIRKSATVYFIVKKMNKIKLNQSNSRHTTPHVVLHGLKFALIVFRVVNNYCKIYFTAFRIVKPFRKATC